MTDEMPTAEEWASLSEANAALREALDAYRSLRDVVAGILSRARVGEIAEALAGAAETILGARRTDVYVADPEQRQFVHILSRPADSGASATLDLPPETLLWILRERKGMFLSDAAGDRWAFPLHSARLCEGIVVAYFAGGHGEMTEEMQEHFRMTAVAVAASLASARLNDTLARAGDYLTNILESVNHGICVTDRAGRITRVNHNFLLMFDLESNQAAAAGRLVNDVLSESVRLVFQELVAEVEREGFAIDRLVERKDADGNDLALGVSGTFLRGAGGDRIGMIFICRDMTASRELERLRRLTQLKSEFVSNVSHELRTPLTSIKAYTEALQEMTAEETAQRFLRVIAEESDRLLVMIENLLNVSRIESGKLRLARERVAPADLIASVLSVAEVQLGNHTLVKEIDPELPAMSLDAGKIKEVLLNLLSNAIKYSPAGGPVRLVARMVEGNLRVDVSDQGLGISPENQERLFEPFFRVENDATAAIRGTGLGLAITKKIVEAHGGTIRVESTPGKGSTFTILLPVSTRLRDDEIDYGGVSSSPFA